MATTGSASRGTSGGNVRGAAVTMENPHPEETLEPQESPSERRPGRPGGRIRPLEAPQCSRCLITFADSKFLERHLKREHPADFVAQKLRGVLFVCFICTRPFLSSEALILHQRSHGPGARAPPAGAAAAARARFPCPDCGKAFAQTGSLRRHLRRHRQVHVARPFACTECGQDFAQEAGLHQHYIRHARGEL
ncbi:zinc finger protein 576 isoform X1 [Lepus europaeus]|uniref:zinc finger protein 576 isoform X1 n=2 Tax=Lepus europaeus TaxID=9983 RepID=UPI002B45BCD0|nr:zinc finger protein 576 isoform X1 [Lepus europaeus]